MNLSVAVLSNQKTKNNHFVHFDTIHLKPSYKVSLLNFQNLFYCNNFFRINSTLPNPLLELSNYILKEPHLNYSNKSLYFSPYNNIISIYESSNYFNLPVECWKPMKFICLEKSIVNSSCISDYKGIFKALSWSEILFIMNSNCNCQNINLQINLEFSCLELVDNIPFINICIQFSFCNPYYVEPKNCLVIPEYCGDLIIDEIEISNYENLLLTKDEILNLNTLFIENNLYTHLNTTTSSDTKFILLNICWQPCPSELNKKVQMNMLIKVISNSFELQIPLGNTLHYGCEGVTSSHTIEIDTNNTMIIKFGLTTGSGLNLQKSEIHNNSSITDEPCLAKIDCNCSCNNVLTQEIYDSNDNCDFPNAAIYLDNCYLNELEKKNLNPKDNTQMIMKYTKCCQKQ